MKGAQICLGVLKGRDAAALYVDGVLEDLLIDSDRPRIGTIYRAKATRPVKGQGGMFFDTPEGSAFLRAGKGIAPGDMLLLQVAGYAEPGKAIPVTTKLLFKGQYAIVTPDAPGINISRSIKDEEQRGQIRAAAETQLAEDTGYGVIMRSACAGADLEDIATDVDHMMSLAIAVLGDTDSELEKLIDGAGPHDIALRDWPGEIRRNVDLSEALDDANAAESRLSGGGSVVVEMTRALTAIDVNTGRDSSFAAGLKTNIEAARILLRLLRLKGLGGQVVVDFAPMPKKDRKALENVLKSASRSDDIETTLIGWTTMGLFEMSRKRARVPLSEAF